MTDSERFMSWYLREHPKRVVDLDSLISASAGTTVDEVIAEVNLEINKSKGKND